MTMLDREQTPVYHLIALAIDSRNTSMSATANVTIYVADKNDNKPVIAFPSASNYTVQVRANAHSQIYQYLLLRVWMMYTQGGPKNCTIFKGV